MSSSTLIPEGFKLAADGKLWLPGDQFYLDAWAAARKLKEEFAGFKYLICLARGGLAFGSVIGNCFDRNDVHVVHAKSYTGEEQGDITITGMTMELLRGGGKDTLIVDDLFDSGKTALAMKQHFPEAVLVALYAKPQGLSVGGRVYKKIPALWVVFPWEDDPRNFVPAAAT